MPSGSGLGASFKSKSEVISVKSGLIASVVVGGGFPIARWIVAERKRRLRAVVLRRVVVLCISTGRAMNCATTNLKSVTNATWGTCMMIRQMHAVLSLPRIGGDGSAFALGTNGLNGYNNGKQLSRMRAELLGFAVLNPTYGDSSRPSKMACSIHNPAGQDAPPTGGNRDE